MNRRYSGAAVLCALCVTLVSWVIASGWPAARLWGINFWWLNPGALWLAVAAVALTGAVTWNWALRTRSEADSGPSQEGRGWLWAGIASTIALGLLYWFLRARTHFQGDGYLLLGELASGQPRFRLLNYGEIWLHDALKNAWPGSDPEAALASFRFMAVAAGLLHSLLVLFVGIRLWGKTFKAFWFALGMMTGGYALLHFGYVENYALFGLCVAAFCYFGLLVSEDRLGLPWACGAALLAVFMHPLGLCLLPAAFFLWLRGSRAWNWITGRSVRVRCALLLLATLPAATAVILAYEDSRFLRLAWVPLATSPFCLEGYSLFSWPHFLDVANLLLLLVPSMWVLLMLQFEPGLGRPARDRPLQFLWITSAVSLACAFAFEAKLGMPRDWDLFSFVGIPVLTLLLYRVLRGPVSRWGKAGVIMAVVLNFGALIDRAVVLHTPELGIRLFRQYADLDRLKNRHGWFLLEQYYDDSGDHRARDEVRELRLKRFPEDQILASAWLLFKQSKLDESLTLTRVALAANPWNSDAWLNLGRILTASGRPESAVVALEIADAFSPGSSPVLEELGLACYSAGDLKNAEKWMLAAHRADTSILEPIISLARLYQARGDLLQYEQWLSRAVFRPDAFGTWARELGDLYLKQSDPARAAQAYGEALGKGSDSVVILRTLKLHPEMQPYFEH